MRDDIKDTISFLAKEDISLFNKAELARRYNCDPRTIAMAVYKFICKKGYTGKYSIVADFVRYHKDVETKKATIRFETNPGLQAQVDWKEDILPPLLESRQLNTES